MTRRMVLVMLVMSLMPSPVPARGGSPPIVRTMRVPDGGIQPQVVARGDVVHLLYVTGDPKAADVRYARSIDGGRSFGESIRVNSEPGSAIAIGTVRGPRLAVGKNGRVHVAWMGSSRAAPKGPGNAVPMLYARMTDAGETFEPQRNVIAEHAGLDGGGTVAADRDGNVYVVWHAPAKPGDHDEQGRVVWVARSTDDGKTFAAERRANAADTGVCACCGLDAVADDDSLLVLYRSANERVHRDMHLLRMNATNGQVEAGVLDRLNVGVCVMSTAAMVRTSGPLVAAWEGRGEVFYGALDATRLTASSTAPPGDGKNRKHPRLAVNAAGQALLVWTEDTAWNRGGTIGWQLLDEQLKPLGPAGRADGLPAWGTAAPFATRDGGFAIVY
jgi:hypothetical protein